MRLARRVGRLERPGPGSQWPASARSIATEVAAEMGLDPEAVVREAEVNLAHAEAAGVLGSEDALAAFLGAETGIAPDAILAEAQRIVRWQ